MMTVNRIFLISTFVLILSAGYSQKGSPITLDSLFGHLHDFNQLNGNVLVAEKGRIVYKHSFGFANVSLQIPNTADMAFSLASVSKVFTSVAILQLRDRQKLKLDDKVHQYLPEFPYAEISIRNLLSHTSGLPDYQIYEEMIAANPMKIFTNEDVIPALKQWKKPLDARPGERWEYSNTNFCLLALLVEKLSRMDFAQYLKKYVFGPSGMTHTFFATDSIAANNQRHAVNHEFQFFFSKSLTNSDSIARNHWRLYNASGFVGQGNIFTTTGDMLLFDQVLYSGRLLKAVSMNEAFSPATLCDGRPADTHINLGVLGKAYYGLGWFVLADSSLGKIVYHTGGQPGGLSFFMRNITKQQTVILFDNAFDKTLYVDGANAMSILNGIRPVTPKISPAQAYGGMLSMSGADAAFCTLNQMIADSANYTLNEDEINELGLQLLYAAKFDKDHILALEVLKFNTLFFPKSFNTYDSYGEALAKAGKKQEAVYMYKKSLELNPDNNAGRRALNELMK